MQRLIPDEIWNILVLIVNRNMVANYSSSKSNPIKAVTIKDLIHWYGVWIKIENTFGNSTRNLNSHLRSFTLPKIWVSDDSK